MKQTALELSSFSSLTVANSVCASEESNSRLTFPLPLQMVLQLQMEKSLQPEQRQLALLLLCHLIASSAFSFISWYDLFHTGSHNLIILSD